MSYLKSTSPIFQTPPPYSLTAQPPPTPHPMRLTVLYAKPTVWGWSRGVAAQSGATATLATTTRYMITDHRHAPSKHSTTAAQIRDYNPACLSAFLPLTQQGAQPKMCQTDGVFTNHTDAGFEDASHIFLNLSFCFSSHPLESKPQTFLYHKLTQQFHCDN